MPPTFILTFVLVILSFFLLADAPRSRYPSTLQSLFNPPASGFSIRHPLPQILKSHSADSEVFLNASKRNQVVTLRYQLSRTSCYHEFLKHPAGIRLSAASEFCLHKPQAGSALLDSRPPHFVPKVVGELCPLTRLTFP